MRYFAFDDLPQELADVIDEICEGGISKEEFLETCDKIVICFYNYCVEKDDNAPERAIDLITEAHERGANEQQMHLLMYVLTDAHVFAFDVPEYVEEIQETIPDKKTLFDDYKPKLYLN